MGEEAEEGRPPGDGSKGRRAPAIGSVSADTFSHPCRGPPFRTRPPRGRGGGRWAETSPGRPAPRTWPVAVAAGLSRSAGPHNRPGPLAPLPRSLRRPGSALVLGGSGAQGQTYSLPRCPARLLACSTQRDTIHDWPPKPGRGSPGSRLGPAPKPAPSRGGASGR